MLAALSVCPIVVGLAKPGRIIAAGIKHPYDAHDVILDAKGDRGAMFEAEDPNPGRQIVAFDAALWKCRELHACGFDAIDIGRGAGTAGSGGDIIVEFEQVGGGLWAESDPIGHVV
ncbi:hypothetical protein OO17_06700 [Rhodopseudomonas palustris]|uniref:Uncharacterized protein n=1 Tax=Rhodopseudomonas palustris TaxID=1076 RepID=A0A0D7F0T3_RHOPL|nr:hypothetical protein OO17_06700 [Rhodopseudomonas palustris]